MSRAARMAAFPKGCRVVVDDTRMNAGGTIGAGIVIGYAFRTDCIRVLRDGFKNADNWHVSFLQVVSE